MEDEMAEMLDVLARLIAALDGNHYGAVVLLALFAINKGGPPKG